MDEIINVLNKSNILYNNTIEQEMLYNRINISYESFLKSYKDIENQYNRCLKYTKFDNNNETDCILYRNIMVFYMKKFDEKCYLLIKIQK